LDFKAHLFAALFGALVAGCSDGTSEVILLTSIDRVHLYEYSLDGVRFTGVIHVLEKGTVTPVVECIPTKSDIEVVVLYKEKKFVVGRGEYKFIRRKPDRMKDPKSLITSSCWKLLPGLG
jgi:hypothetical protein